MVGVDALCPFGGIETLGSLISSATLIQRVAASSVIILGLVLAMAFMFRRAFCGYICPLGALQEFAGKLGSALFRGRRPRMPKALDVPARYLKYAVLAVFAFWSWQAASLVMRPYDPWVAFMHLSSGEVFAEFTIGLGVLVVSLVGSVVYDRFFCKYLCPMGAFLGVISPLSVFKVRRNADTCIDCGAFDKACPVNLPVAKVEVVTDVECINCNECVSVCPVKDTLTVSAGRRLTAPRRLRPTTVLGAVFAMTIVVLGLTTATGSFAWTLPTLDSTAASSGRIDVGSIRGSMTFREIAKATGIPESAFAARFDLGPAEMDSRMKDLAETHDFDVENDVRGFVTEKTAPGFSP